MLVIRGRCAPTLLVLLFAGTIAATPGTQAHGAEPHLDGLLAELDEAQREQDQERLRSIYTELAEIQPGNPEFQRGLGLICYLQGDFPGATTALERAVGLNPGMPGVRLYLGISYYRTNRFPEALASLARAPELESEDPTALYWQGATYRALGRLAEAISALEAAHSVDRNNLDVLQLLVRSQSEHAAEWLRQLLTVAAASPPGRLLRAEELAMDGVGDAALRELDTALAEDPGLAGLRRAKGELLWSREQYEAGAEQFRLELENDPYSVESHVRLGRFYLDLDNPAAALGHLEQAQRFGPSDQGVRELLEKALAAGGSVRKSPVQDGGSRPVSRAGLLAAREFYRRGDPAHAAVLLERLLEVRPASVVARRLLVRCRLAVGNIGQAVTELRQILEIEEDDPEALYLLGRSYERLASDGVQKLFEANPRSTAIRLLRGESFERGPRYEFERALVEFRAANNLDPEDPGVHHANGRILFKLKRFDEAIPHLEAALGLNRGHAMASYLLGRIRLLQGDRGAAIELLRVAVDARPDLSDARRDLARALVLEGHHEEGIRIYRGLVEEGPPDASLHALLATAYRRAGRIQEAKAEAERARQIGAN